MRLRRKPAFIPFAKDAFFFRAIDNAIVLQTRKGSAFIIAKTTLPIMGIAMIKEAIHSPKNAAGARSASTMSAAKLDRIKITIERPNPKSSDFL